MRTLLFFVLLVFPWAWLNAHGQAVQPASKTGAELTPVDAPAQAPAPRALFRGGTDLVQVDVSVLDKKRHPVRGLTAEDFSILEDGHVREIQAFTEVYLPA